MQELQNALDEIELPEEHHFRYPLGHTTRLSNFLKILESKHLTPQKCKILEKDVLYCTYGAIHYIAKGEPNNLLQRPVGMILNSEIVCMVDEYYPLDTGMVKSGKEYDNPRWKQSLLRIMPKTKLIGLQCSINSCDVKSCHINLCKLIYTLYGSHSNYMAAKCSSSFKFKEKDLNILQSCLMEMVNVSGVDNRGRTIECHLEREVALLRYLECIILPEEHQTEFYEFLKPFKNDYNNWPKVLTYDSTEIFHPDECAIVVKKMALEYIKETYLSRYQLLTRKE